MSYDDFFESNDDYIIEGSEHNRRQPPTVSRRLSKLYHDRENEIKFYEWMMRQSTSYKSYASDDYGKSNKIDDWYAKLKQEQAQRARTLQKIAEGTTQNEKLRKQLSEME